MPKKKLTDNPSGILPFAKQSGITSFSSLWSIKHALNTEKVGHTGTLDSFADGLLVVLSGSLTHLVPHITGFKKTYLAVVCFGTETDTLDPCGKIIKEKTPPSRESVEDACKKFTGALLQIPPVFSAIHVGGQRASDMVRSGNNVELEPRQIFVYSNTLLDFKEPCLEDKNAYALIKIECSKGTYIRALARDMAEYVESCAHLSALRRTQVGPFNLSDAACYSYLPEFTIENGILNDKRFAGDKDRAEKIKDSDEKLLDIKNHFLAFTPELAHTCGLKADILKKEHEKSYLNGRPLNGKMFTRIEFSDSETEINADNLGQSDEIAVFYHDGMFAGMIKLLDRKLTYSFVVPKKKDASCRIFSWEQILNGNFPVEWRSRGTAITVGSFDGLHAGHEALLNTVISKSGTVPGVVTFRNSVRAVSDSFEGDVSNLDQKLELLSRKGIAFVVVIDFSDDFSRIEGSSFFEVLLKNCNMKWLVEGKDFRCGYKGAFDMNAIRVFAQEHLFNLEQVDDVMVDSQRVSSTRIRESVVKGDFTAVQKMLLRPFSYDARNLSWKESSAEWFEAKRVSGQILPADGTYSVVVMLSDEDKELNALHTVCSIEKNIIKLSLPSLRTAERVQAINFNH